MSAGLRPDHASHLHMPKRSIVGVGKVWLLFLADLDSLRGGRQVATGAFHTPITERITCHVDRWNRLPVFVAVTTSCFVRPPVAGRRGPVNLGRGFDLATTRCRKSSAAAGPKFTEFQQRRGGTITQSWKPHGGGGGASFVVDERSLVECQVFGLMSGIEWAPPQVESACPTVALQPERNAFPFWCRTGVASTLRVRHGRCDDRDVKASTSSKGMSS